MNLEYYDPNPFLNRFPMNNRIITENLRRNKKINDKFNMAGVMNKLHSQKHIDANKEDFKKVLKGNMKYEFQNWSYFLNVAHSSFIFVDRLVSSIQSDYVLYTSRFGSVFDFYPIKKMLETGIRVVLGGQITTIQTPSEIRVLLKSMGCTNEQLDNLLIVTGFVDLTTDLYSIIDRWEDCTITQNDFNTFWVCEDDYIQKHLNLLSKMKGTNIQLNSNEWNETQVMTIFDDRCWWGKCRFCFMPFMTKNNFISGTHPDIVAQNLIETCRKYQTNNLYITNDYFRFTIENERILDTLITNGIRIGIYGGVIFLKDKEYIQKLNKYISYLMIGLESCDDYALSYISKGYTYKDIIEAFDNVKKYCKKDLYISPCIINDLPYQSRDDVIENYKRIADLQNDMSNSGFKFHLKTRLLNIGWPNVERMTKGNNIVLCDGHSEYMSGNYIMWKYFEELGIFNENIYRFISRPFMRLTNGGEMIESDMFIVPESIYEGIFMKD